MNKSLSPALGKTQAVTETRRLAPSVTMRGRTHLGFVGQMCVVHPATGRACDQAARLPGSQGTKRFPAILPLSIPGVSRQNPRRVPWTDEV